MATQAQIDAAKAVLAAALDAVDANGKNVSTYNGGVVPASVTFADAMNAGLAAIQALGLDTAPMVAALNVASADLTAAGKTVRALSNAVAAMTADPIPDPVPDPIPDPVPAPTVQVVHSMLGLTDAARADIATATYWQKSMGDWLDADGVFNGPKPTISASGKVATIDISSLPGDILIQGVSHATAVLVDGKNPGVMFTDPTSNHAFPIPTVTVGWPNHTAQPIIVPNDTGKSLTITSSTTGTFRIDLVALPKAIVPALVKGYTPPNILRINPTSFDAVVIAGSVPAASTAYNKCFGDNRLVTYETDRGVPFAKAHCPAIYYPTTGAGRVARCDYPIPPTSSLFVAYLLYIGPDVWDAVTDIGVKLSGMGGNEGRWNIGEHISSYTPIFTKNPRNRPLIALRDYFYSAEATSGQGAGNGQNSGKAFGFLRSPGWTLIETGSVANTFNPDGTANSDGVKRTWINGALVEDRKIKWFANAASRWTQMSLQVYHGGTGSLRWDCWWGVGPFMCSTEHIGVDPAFEPLLAA